MNKTDLENLAQIRLEEAKTLLDNRHYSGAYYLCGYVVECALKACIAKNTQQYDFPDKKIADKSWTHDFGQLLIAAKLDKARKAVADDIDASWVTVEKWSENSRYNCYTEQDAIAIYNSVASPVNGVLQWVKQYY